MDCLIRARSRHLRRNGVTRGEVILAEWERIKKQTLTHLRLHHQARAAETEPKMDQTFRS